MLSLVEIGWRIKFLNFVSVFSQFRNYLPLENFNKLEPSSLKDALCQVWLKLALWFWSGEEDKNVKSLWRRQQQRQTTDKFQSEKLKKNLGTFKSNMISLLHDTSTCSTYMYMYTVWYNNTHTVLVWLWLTWLSPSLYCEYWSVIHWALLWKLMMDWLFHQGWRFPYLSNSLPDNEKSKFHDNFHFIYGKFKKIKAYYFKYKDYCIPWSSNPWVSSWPITTPIAPKFSDL